MTRGYSRDIFNVLTSTRNSSTTCFSRKCSCIYETHNDFCQYPSPEKKTNTEREGKQTPPKKRKREKPPTPRPLECRKKKGESESMGVGRGGVREGEGERKEGWEGKVFGGKGG